MLINALLVLSGLSFVLAVLTFLWPRRFSFAAYGWHRSRRMCACGWLCLCTFFFSLACLLILHSLRGWCWPLYIFTALAIFNIGALVHMFRNMSRPLFLDDIDRLVYQLTEKSRGLPDSQKKELHESMRRKALDEIEQIAAAIGNEQSAENIEQKIVLGIRKSLWEDVAEKHPELFPPKQ